MPKLKTHKGVWARFKVTGTGKLMRTKYGRGHLRRNKSKRVKGSYDVMHPVHASDIKRVKKLLPYGMK